MKIKLLTNNENLYFTIHSLGLTETDLARIKFTGIFDNIVTVHIFTK